MIQSPSFLSDVVHYGCPWHGLVTGNSLALPNATTKTWEYILGNGNADIVRVAGLPVPTTTVDEAAAGKEWRNYALITGAKRVFYGKELGENHWVYVPSAGNGYHLAVAVDTCTADGSGGEIELTVSVWRLRFTAGPETVRTFSAALTGIGQDQIGGADRTLTAAVVAQSETGAKILIELSYDSAVVGWVEGTVSGTSKSGIGLSLAVKKDREATLWRDGQVTCSTSGTEECGSLQGSISDRTEAESHFVYAGWYDDNGDAVFAECILQLDHHWQNSGSITWGPSCAYVSGSGSESFDSLDRIRVEIDGVEVCSAEFTIDIARSSGYVGSSEFTGFDGSTTAVWSQSTSNPHTGHVTSINCTARSSAMTTWLDDTVSMISDFRRVLLPVSSSTTPALSGSQCSAPIPVTVLDAYGRDDYLAWIAKKGRHAAAIERRDDGSTVEMEIMGLLTEAGYAAMSTPVDIKNGSGSDFGTTSRIHNIRIAHQPETGDTAYTTNSTVVGYV